MCSISLTEPSDLIALAFIEGLYAWLFMVSIFHKSTPVTLVTMVMETERRGGGMVVGEGVEKALMNTRINAQKEKPWKPLQNYKFSIIGHPYYVV